MEIDNAILVAIISAIIAGLALMWAIFTHFSSRKISKLTYEISQISDFGVPESFLEGMRYAPIALTMTSRGNKSVEKIVLNLETVHEIEDCEVTPGNLPITYKENQLSLEVSSLNPSQEIKLFVRCSDADPYYNQILNISLSHSEGIGIDVNDIKTISFSIMGIELEYNLQSLKTSITRLGPITFK
jgi:hypothetical protein